VNFFAAIGDSDSFQDLPVKNNKNQIILERKNCLVVAKFTTREEVQYNNDEQDLVLVNGVPTFKNRKLSAEDFLKYYEIYGEDVLKQIEGLFYILLLKNDQLRIFTDPLGTKLVYYRVINKENCVVSSEFKRLLAFDGIEKQLNSHALAHFLAYGFVPSPETIVRIVYKVPAGSVFCFDINSRKMRITRMCDFWRQLLTSYNSQVNLTSDMLLEKIADAIHVGVENEPKILTLLSGGLDSSTVTAVARRCLGLNITAFNVAFPDETIERPLAQKVCEYLNVDLNVFYISDKDVIDTIQLLPRMYDEPVGDVVASTPYVYALKRIQSTEPQGTLLTGDGGDSLFFGIYWKIRRKYIIDMLLKTKLNQLGTSLHEHTRKLLNYYFVKIDPRYWTYTCWWMLPPNLLNKLMPTSPDLIFEDFDSIIEGIPADSLTKMYIAPSGSRFDFPRIDSLSKNLVIKTYLPLMNTDLTKFAFSIPTELKIKNNVTKYILRKMLLDKKLLPRDIALQRQIGFGYSLLENVLKGEALDFCIGELEDKIDLLKDYVNLKTLKNLILDKERFIGFKYALYILTDFVNQFSLV
jgi:asparagine synthase (glutamine-hydrolysing)